MVKFLKVWDSNLKFSVAPLNAFVKFQRGSKRRLLGYPYCRFQSINMSHAIEVLIERKLFAAEFDRSTINVQRLLFWDGGGGGWKKSILLDFSTFAHRFSMMSKTLGRWQTIYKNKVTGVIFYGPMLVISNHTKALCMLTYLQ